MSDNSEPAQSDDQTPVSVPDSFLLSPSQETAPIAAEEVTSIESSTKTSSKISDRPAANDVPPPRFLSGVALESEADFTTYKTVDLLALADALTKRNDFLTAENDVFEAFYGRSLGVGGVKQDDEQALPDTATLIANEVAQQEREKRREEKRAQKKKAAGAVGAGAVGQPEEQEKKMIQLTIDQKYELALKEMDEIKDEVEVAKGAWTVVIDDIRADIEEAEVRMTDLKKTELEFKRNIEEGAVHDRIGKIMAEKLVRWNEECIREKDGLVEKIKLKNATLQSTKKKIQSSLKQKEEMGEVLHAIDFDQLQIENKQYLAKIEERNQELIKLKMTATNTVQILNTHKAQLAGLSKESGKLKHEISSKKDFLTKLQQEREKVTVEIEREELTQSKLGKAVAEYKVPSVVDYVLVKANEYAMSKKVRSWDRKVEIASMHSQRIKNNLRKQIERHPTANTIALPPIEKTPSV